MTLLRRALVALGMAGGRCACGAVEVRPQRVDGELTPQRHWRDGDELLTRETSRADPEPRSAADRRAVVAVMGLGAVGSRAARQLASTDGVDEVVLRDRRADRLDEVVALAGSGRPPTSAPTTHLVDADACPGRARRCPRRAARPHRSGAGRPWCPRSDAIPDVTACSELDTEAAARGSRWRSAPAFAPGLTACSPASPQPASPRSTRSTSPGSAPGGPACARQHHRVARRRRHRLARRGLGRAPGAVRAASCAGSPIRSAPRTATGPALPDAAAAGPGVPRRQPGHRPPGRQPS